MRDLEDTCKKNNQENSLRENIKGGIIVGGCALFTAVIFGLGSYYAAKKCGADDKFAFWMGVSGAVGGMYGGVMSGQEVYRDFNS